MFSVETVHTNAFHISCFVPENRSELRNYARARVLGHAELSKWGIVMLRGFNLWHCCELLQKADKSRCGFLRHICWQLISCTANWCQQDLLWLVYPLSVGAHTTYDKHLHVLVPRTLYRQGISQKQTFRLTEKKKTSHCGYLRTLRKTFENNSLKIIWHSYKHPTQTLRAQRWTQIGNMFKLYSLTQTPGSLWLGWRLYALWLIANHHIQILGNRVSHW